MASSITVITGASAGIGAALARKLVSENHRVVLSARREKELNDVVAELGSGARGVVGDMTKRADVERLRDTAIETFGQIDVWVNNVGRGIVRHVLDLSDEDIDETIAANLKSAIYGMQAIVPHFQQQKRGHLINVSSFLGRVPVVTVRSIYSASKAALNVLTANLRVDLSKDYPDIHVSLAMPGMTLTEFHQNAIGAPQGSPGGNRPSAVPSQTADEVADAIADLIAQPKSEIYTNPALAEFALKYRQDIDGFEKMVRERMK